MEQRIIIIQCDVSTEFVDYIYKVGGFINLSIMVELKDKRIPSEILEQWKIFHKNCVDVMELPLEIAYAILDNEFPKDPEV